MMKVDGICRCGNKLDLASVTPCTHCDNVCILNPRSCSFCKALNETGGDAEYYDYHADTK